jgi:hypothetical protein
MARQYSTAGASTLPAVFGSRRAGLVRLAVLVLLVASVVTVVVVVRRPGKVSPGAATGTIGSRLAAAAPAARDRQAYAGLGAWMDGFDYGPAYQSGGQTPPLRPTVVDDMAAHGVATVFVQVVRDDPRSPGGVVDRALAAEVLLRAHRRGLRVVGWYLPTFTDVAADLAHLAQIADFSVLGHRFDGVAVDIEDTDDVPDVGDRNQRLVDLSTELRAVSGGDTLGAIVLPPVLTEVVNEQFWPDFPWTQLRPLYDVWLPMSYWTFRKASSGYKDGYTYNDESTRRLRADLDEPTALVHAVGGIGDLVTEDDLQRFAQSLADDGAIGGSIYDWNSMTPATRAALQSRFATGPAARLPRPP